jgi:hypothetical protein
MRRGSAGPLAGQTGWMAFSQCHASPSIPPGCLVPGLLLRADCIEKPAGRPQPPPLPTIDRGTGICPAADEGAAVELAVELDTPLVSRGHHLASPATASMEELSSVPDPTNIV